MFPESFSSKSEFYKNLNRNGEDNWTLSSSAIKLEIAIIAQATRNFFAGKESDPNRFFFVNNSRINILHNRMNTLSPQHLLSIKSEVIELQMILRHFEYLKKIFPSQNCVVLDNSGVNQSLKKYYEPYLLPYGSLADHIEYTKSFWWPSTLGNVENLVSAVFSLALFPSKLPLVSNCLKFYNISKGNIYGLTGAIDLSTALPELQMNWAMGFNRHAALVNREFANLQQILKRSYADYHMRCIGQKSLKIQQEAYQQILLLRKIESKLLLRTGQEDSNAYIFLSKIIEKITKGLEANLEILNNLQQSFFCKVHVRGEPLIFLDKIQDLADDLRIF